MTLNLNLSGMNIGATRKIADMKIDDMSKEGQGMIGLQAGSNKGASQAGMIAPSDIKLSQLLRGLSNVSWH